MHLFSPALYVILTLRLGHGGRNALVDDEVGHADEGHRVQVAPVHQHNLAGAAGRMGSMGRLGRMGRVGRIGRTGRIGGSDDLGADAAELGGLLLGRGGGVEDAAYMVLDARVVDTCKERGMDSHFRIET